MIRRRARVSRIAAATGALLAVAALSACSGSSEDPADTASAGSPSASYNSTARVTITIWHGQTADAEKAITDLAAKYHSLHPNVTVVVQPGASNTDDLKQKIAAGFVSGDYPDASYVYGSWAGELGQSGKMLDLTSWVQEPQVGWSDFPEASRATATVGGKVIGFPAILGNLAVIYNKALFDKAGLPYPTPDWTWDDFRADAKKRIDTLVLLREDPVAGLAGNQVFITGGLSPGERVVSAGVAFLHDGQKARLWTAPE